jgi:hypothetical protein
VATKVNTHVATKVNTHVALQQQLAAAVEEVAYRRQAGDDQVNVNHRHAQT